MFLIKNKKIYTPFYLFHEHVFLMKGVEMPGTEPAKILLQGTIVESNTPHTKAYSKAWTKCDTLVHNSLHF